MNSYFQKRRMKERLYDKMHKASVNVLMGITVITSLCLGYKVYEYYRYVRPLQLAQNKLTEDELLHEGRNIEDSPKIELS